MFTERLAISCTSSIIIFWFPKLRKVLVNAVPQKFKITFVCTTRQTVTFAYHFSFIRRSARSKSSGVVTCNKFTFWKLCLQISGSGHYSWNVIQEYLNVCVRAFRDIDWVFEIFHNGYIISDFKAIPAMAKSSQQRA